jgi:hypothetical protein
VLPCVARWTAWPRRAVRGAGCVEDGTSCSSQCSPRRVTQGVPVPILLSLPLVVCVLGICVCASAISARGQRMCHTVHSVCCVSGWHNTCDVRSGRQRSIRFTGVGAGQRREAETKAKGGMLTNTHSTQLYNTKAASHGGAKEQATRPGSPRHKHSQVSHNTSMPRQRLPTPQSATGEPSIQQSRTRIQRRPILAIMSAQTPRPMPTSRPRTTVSLC